MLSLHRLQCLCGFSLEVCEYGKCINWFSSVRAQERLPSEILLCYQDRASSLSLHFLRKEEEREPEWGRVDWKVKTKHTSSFSQSWDMVRMRHIEAFDWWSLTGGYRDLWGEPPGFWRRDWRSLWGVDRGGTLGTLETLFIGHCPFLIYGRENVAENWDLPYHY